MTRHGVHLAAAAGVLLFAGNAGAITTPFGLAQFSGSLVQITPEPASMLLLGMGLAGILARRIVPVKVKK